MRTLLIPAPLLVGEVTVVDEEAHHGRSVLRLRVGDVVRVADGAGSAGRAEVVTCERERLVLRVTEVESLPATAAELIAVACAVPKGDRFSDLVRGLTELGVGRIQPLQCERGERLPSNLERPRRIAAEALKQCRRGRLPELGPAVDIPTLAGSSARLIILDRAGAAPCAGEPRATTLVIGPEGGFTDTEVESLLAAGGVQVRLAATVLRIETAALAAAAVWAAAWEASHP